jgi:hypothetical protein
LLLSTRAKVALRVSCWLALALCVSVGAVALMREVDWGDCGGGPPVYKPDRDRPVFVARVVHFDRFSGSIALVQEKFWDFRYPLKLVFLKAFWKPGETYFVSGRLSSGLLARWFLPVINMHCSRSNLARHAIVDLRVLSSGPKPGVRIMGSVRGRKSFAVADANVLIEGPQGTLEAVSDKDGIYDAIGLPPGDYKIRLDRAGIPPRRETSCPDDRTIHFVSGDVSDCILFDPTH